MHTLRALLLASCFISVFAVMPAAAQMTDSFALTHPFALPGATTARLAGMGGFVACIGDQGFGNPAYAGLLTQASAVARYSATSFDSGLDLDAEQVSVAVPLKPGVRGLQVTGFRLTSNTVSLGGALPADLSASEYDVSLHYGERVTPRLAVGIALSPVFHNAVNMDTPALPQFTTYLHSSSKSGFRLGAVYDLPRGLRLGALYDHYSEDVVANGPYYPGPVAADYTSEEMAAGLSVPLKSWLLGAIEWQQMTTEGATTRQGNSGWRVGLEAQLPEGWSVRAGDNDGALCAGLGYARGGWSGRYAFVSNWNDDATGALLGGSDTHQLELTYTW